MATTVEIFFLKHGLINRLQSMLKIRQKMIKDFNLLFSFI